MTREDDQLQDQLAAMEQGQSPSGDAETASLVKLAAAVRELPHPEQSVQAIRQQQDKLLATNSQAKGSSQSSDMLRWIVFPAFASGIVGLFLLAIVVFGLVAGPLGAHTARLTEVNGVVELARADAPDTWLTAQVGDKLRSGDLLRTSAESSAELAYYDGSRTLVDAVTELSLDRVDGAWGGILRVVLTQRSGQTDHSVTPQRNPKSLYVVYTPASAASVHGTEFSVAINTTGQSRYAVERGQVLVSNETGEAYLTTGQVATAHSDGLLDEPGYRFTLQGVIDSKLGSVWFVADVPVTVSPEALSEGEPQVGDAVKIEGHTLADGEWVADWVRLAVDERQQVKFYGILESNSGDTWQISGWQVLVTDKTEIPDGLQLGQIVKVKLVTLPDGRWQAVSIELVGEEEPSPEPEITPDPAAQPELEFEPDELEATICGNAADLTGTLWNEGEEADDVAANVVIGYQIIRGAAYVDSVTLDPANWATIAAGEQVTFDVHLNLSDLWSSAPDETEVKVRVFIVQETNREDEHPSRLTVTVERDCTPGPTKTPTVTFTPGPSPTPTITPTPAPTSTGDTNCTGAQPHPTGMKLAARYGVPYEEIMGWFCQGFGFGEIDQAYTLSRISGKPVAEIFAMKSGGMGWGEIKKLLDPKDNQPKDKDKKKDK